MILPETGTGLERLAQGLETAVQVWATGRTEKIPPLGSISAGGRGRQAAGLSVTQLLEAADARLYEAKASRRERCAQALRS